MKFEKADNFKRIVRPIDFGHPDHASFQSGLEVQVISGLLNKISNKNNPHLVEIGTYRGVSTSIFFHLNNNLNIHTINVLPEQLDENVIELLPKDEIGKVARDKGIPFTQHYFDSRYLPNWSVIPNYDFAFIDGDHRYNSVILDSMNVLSKANKGAILVWHDYGDDTDLRKQVKQALDYLNESVFNDQLKHIEGTSLIYWINQN